MTTEQTVVEMPVDHVPCIYCGGPNPKARRAIDKDHCMETKCIAEWRRRRLEEHDLVLVFVHKQGLRWIKRSEVPDNDMKRQGGN